MSTMYDEIELNRRGVTALYGEHSAIDICYSPDDGGYYLMRGDETSQVVEDPRKLTELLVTDSIEWST